MVFIIRIREILFSGRSWRAGLYVVAFCFFFLSLSALPSGAQVNREKFVLHVHKTLQPVTVDGVLDEPCWQRAEVAKDFFRILPIDTGQARAQTEVRVTYDDKNLYFGIVCYDPTPGKRPVESLRRDFKFPLNDNFLIFMDTYNDLTNGFSFGISAAGAQWDGIQANGGYVSLRLLEAAQVPAHPERDERERPLPLEYPPLQVLAPVPDEGQALKPAAVDEEGGRGVPRSVRGEGRELGVDTDVQLLNHNQGIDPLRGEG
jgi:hypothetical protein